MKATETVQIKLSDSLFKYEPPKIYIAANCTNDEVLRFFSVIDDKKPHVKLSIKCGVDVEKMDDHGELFDQLDDIHLVSQALYFHSKNTTECLDCVMRSFPDFVIDGVQIGSEM